MFQPKHWHDGHQFRTAFIVRSMRKNAEILIIDSTARLSVKKIPLAEAEQLQDIDYGAAQERKMKSSLRRIVKKKGTTKTAKKAVKEILAQKTTEKS